VAVPENVFPSEAPLAINATRYTVHPSFEAMSGYTNSTEGILREWMAFIARARNWKVISPQECFLAYNKQLVSKTRNVAVMLYGNNTDALLNSYIISALTLPMHREEWDIEDPIWSVIVRSDQGMSCRGAR
jgi:hypothetical protein